MPQIAQFFRHIPWWLLAAAAAAAAILFIWIGPTGAGSPIPIRWIIRWGHSGCWTLLSLAAVARRFLRQPWPGALAAAGGLCYGLFLLALFVEKGIF